VIENGVFIVLIINFRVRLGSTGGLVTLHDEVIEIFVHLEVHLPFVVVMGRQLTVDIEAGEAVKSIRHILGLVVTLVHI
jgi:hypothetical protein